MSLWARLLKDEEGQGMAEYGLLVALIALVVIGALTALGGNLSAIFETIGSKLGEHVPGED
ncbi:MAG TPA: Flp family type IVb pilin [Firmicutes bacterium]|nr:Flp family type IVb pilin [Bacillota bacterium]